MLTVTNIKTPRGSAILVSEQNELRAFLSAVVVFSNFHLYCVAAWEDDLTDLERKLIAGETQPQKRGLDIP